MCVQLQVYDQMYITAVVMVPIIVLPYDGGTNVLYGVVASNEV